MAASQDKGPIATAMEQNGFYAGPADDAVMDELASMGDKMSSDFLLLKERLASIDLTGDARKVIDRVMEKNGLTIYLSSGFASRLCRQWRLSITTVIDNPTLMKEQEQPGGFALRDLIVAALKAVKEDEEGMGGSLGFVTFPFKDWKYNRAYVVVSPDEIVLQIVHKDDA